MRPGSEQEVGFIVHVGDDKKAGGQPITINTEEQKEVWLVEKYDTPLLRREEALTKLAGSLSTQCAHWCVAACPRPLHPQPDAGCLQVPFFSSAFLLV